MGCMRARAGSRSCVGSQRAVAEEEEEDCYHISITSKWNCAKCFALFQTATTSACSWRDGGQTSARVSRTKGAAHRLCWC